MNNSQLQKKAEKVLQDNLYEITLNGRKYRRTVPSKEFYVHQWNWDSATHAMGLVHVDEERAHSELVALTSGQWRNGLIAQITFNPNERKYFPGPSFWGTERYAVGEIVTSGITQPPLLGVSFIYVYKNTKDIKKAEKFADEILPKVIKYHDYLKKFRDPENSGLLTVVHPWESGLDNSPRWDKPLENIKLSDIPDSVKSLVNKFRSDDKVGDPKHRPGMKDYYKYMYLVHLYKEWGWDYEKIVKDSPFLVKDILFNSIWCWANDLLSDLMGELRKNKEADRMKGYADDARAALQETWDEEFKIYSDLDVSRDNPITIKEDTISIFSPMLGKVVDEQKIDVLLKKLTDKTKYWPDSPVPTTPLDNPKFELTKYWRGPTWPITNLFVIEGLERYRSNDQAKEISKELVRNTIEMVKTNGFYEYFDPTSGVARPDKENAALGFGSFSWTAAVSLYLLNKYKSYLN